MLETPPSLTIRSKFPRPSAALIARFEGALSGHVADCLGGRGALDAAIKPLSDAPAGMKSILGVALTCMNSPGDMLALIGALGMAEPGDVIVAGTESYLGTAVVGDLTIGMARNRGVAGLVTDGAVRDTPGIIGVGLPVYCAGVNPNSPAENGPGSVGLPISLGGVTVNPGDLIVGDVDGVVVVPHETLEAAADALDRTRRAEAEVERQVADGLEMPESWRAKLDGPSTRYID